MKFCIASDPITFRLLQDSGTGSAIAEHVELAAVEVAEVSRIRAFAALGARQIVGAQNDVTECQ